VTKVRFLIICKVRDFLPRLDAAVPSPDIACVPVGMFCLTFYKNSKNPPFV